MIPETHRSLVLPPLHPALEEYRAELQEVARPAWLLRCHKVETISRLQTHIGGCTPFTPVKDGWPMCDRCGEPLEFVAQIDFSDFRGVGTFASRGLFQFFYCWDCFALPPLDEFGYAARWYPDFHADHMQDVVQLDAPHQMARAASSAKPLRVDILPFLSVPGKCSPENPIPEDALNDTVSEEEGQLWAIYSLTEGLYLEDEMISRVGGYPPWVQSSDDTPRCRVCGALAEFVGAIGSDDTGMIWNDSGYWYLFACKATAACRGLNEPLMACQYY